MNASHITESIASLRIDAAINSVSALRRVFYGFLAFPFCIMVYLAPLSLWQYVTMLLISVVIIGYLVQSRMMVLHLSQPPLSKRIDKNWQLMLRTSRSDDALWQADLVDVHRYHWMLSLEFNIVEPYKRKLSVTIFRDQVSLEQWRQLNILATVIPTKIS